MYSIIELDNFNREDADFPKHLQEYKKVEKLPFDEKINLAIIELSHWSKENESKNLYKSFNEWEDMIVDNDINIETFLGTVFRRDYNEEIDWRSILTSEIDAYTENTGRDCRGKYANFFEKVYRKYEIVIPNMKKYENKIKFYTLLDKWTGNDPESGDYLWYFFYDI